MDHLIISKNGDCPHCKKPLWVRVQVFAERIKEVEKTNMEIKEGYKK